MIGAARSMLAEVQMADLSRLVGVLTMANDANLDNRSSVVDCINNPVIAHSYPPQVVSTSQLFAASWARLFGEGVDLRCHTKNDDVWERLNLLGGGPYDSHLMHDGGLS
jgi:hypothetical protein